MELRLLRAWLTGRSGEARAMESVLTTMRPQHRRCVFVRLVVARTMITIPVTASTVMGHYGTVNDFLVT